MVFTKRDTNIVKGVAILMMLFHHTFMLDRFEGHDVIFFNQDLAVMIANNFKICVALFVFVTGYGITCSLNKSNVNIKEMLRKRYIMLMMPFFFVYILMLVLTLLINREYVVQTYFGERKISGIYFMIVDFFGMAKLFKTPSMNGDWWYMSFALIIIALIPVFYSCLKKLGPISLTVLIFFITQAFASDLYDMVRFMFALELGMLACEYDWLAKIKSIRIIKNSKIDLLFKVITYSLVVVFLIWLRNGLNWETPFLRDGIIPFFVVAYSFTVLSEIPLLNKALEFLGKHSSTVFFTHTFIRKVYAPDFVYMFKYVVPIYVMFVIVSFAFAIVVEQLMEISKYETFYQRLAKGEYTFKKESKKA